MINKQFEQKMQKLASLVQSLPDAQFMIQFKGRSLSCTLGTIDTFADSEGNPYTSISFWDSDTGNLFDVSYILVPEKVFANGQELHF